MEKLTTKQAAAYLGLKPNTLDVWRCKRVRYQPPYLKLGRAIRYELADLDAWLAANRFTPLPSPNHAAYQEQAKGRGPISISHSH